MKSRTRRIAILLVVGLLLGLAAVAWAQVAGYTQMSDWFRVVRTRVLEFHGATMAISRATDDSTTDYAIDFGTGLYLTGGAGKLPIVQVMDPVAALSVDGVHAAITIPTGATVTTTVTTAITSPVTYRVLSITGSAAAALSNVVITGTDWAGNTITETITGTGAAKVIGNVAFKTVTQIVVWGVATPGGATYTIGWDDKLGLYRPITVANTGTAKDGDVTEIASKASAGTAWVLTTLNVLPTGAVVNATYNTVQPETTITAADGYMITYNASGW